MHNYLILGVQFRYYYYFLSFWSKSNIVTVLLLKLLQIWPLGIPSSWLFCLSDMPHHFLSTSLLLKMPNGAGMSLPLDLISR